MIASAAQAAIIPFFILHSEDAAGATTGAAAAFYLCENNVFH
jgi:hypothetical protein